MFSNTFNKDENRHLLKFYQGEIYRLRGDVEDNFNKAINLYKESINIKEDFPNAYRELGLLQLKIDKIEEAKKNLKKYLEFSSNPEDASIIRSYIN